MSEARYVLLKRDLFECPKHQGYTGIRDKAGSWTLDELQGLDLPIRAEYERWQQEHYALPLEAAPEFTNACFPDLARDHLIEQRDALRAALARAEANAGEPVAGMYGEYTPVTVGTSTAHPAPQPSETVESYWKTWAAQLEGYLRAKGDYDYPPLSALTAGKPEQAVPSGWKLVPEEPTEAMLAAYWAQTGESEKMRSRVYERAKRYYRVMLSAAPSAPTAGGGDA